jgi:hypothetical protein
LVINYFLQKHEETCPRQKTLPQVFPRNHFVLQWRDMARVGKIARLPAAVRDELNRHLENGALGKNIVPWLNALPEVQRILTELFGGQPISENNLSNWRRGGFQDWLRDQECHRRLEKLAASGPPEFVDQLDAQLQKLLIVELAEQLERLAAVKDPAEQFKRLIRLSRELCRLHKSRTHDLEISLSQAKSSDFPQAHSTPVQPA